MIESVLPSPVRRIAPGLLFCTVIGLAAAFVSGHYGGPVLLYALLIGMAFHHLSIQAPYAEGIQFTAKKVLRFGVALLGVRISLEQILALGWAPVVIVLAAIPATIAIGMLGARLLRLNKSQGVLTGGSVAICGASAAIAIASVLPQRPETEKYLVFTIVGVTTLSTIAMVFYPLVVSLFGLDDTLAGIFIGGTIHDVAQVAGAGYIISEPAGDTAIFTKLLRVAVLAPVVIAISLLVARGGHANSGQGPALPGFLLAFIALVIINSFGWIPDVAIESINTVSRACLVAAIAAIGVKASFAELAELGWRPVWLLLIETVFLAVLVLGAILWLAAGKN